MATKANETVEAASTDIELVDVDGSATRNVKAEIAEFRSGDSGILSTFVGDDFFQVAKLQLAATSGSDPLDEHLGETIMLDNFVIQPVEIPATDQRGNFTGELNQSARVTLVDSTNGKSYHGTSIALVNSLKQIVAALGDRMPKDWAEPLPIKVTREKARSGFQFFKITVVL